MSEIHKPGHPEDPRKQEPRFLRERVTQEDMDFLTITGMYNPAAWRNPDGSQTPEMLDAATAEIERLTGKRVGMTAAEIRHSQEAQARLKFSGKGRE